MKKLEIYLDTSVLNFLFADDAPEKRDITLEFFEGVRKGKRIGVSHRRPVAQTPIGHFLGSKPEELFASRESSTLRAPCR